MCSSFTGTHMNTRYKHGHSSASGRSPTYRSWHSMKQRVSNPNATGARNYSVRGIDMDPAWEDFAVFLNCMGERPAGTSLDRIDNSKGYWPGNCRWATPVEQLSNRRGNVYIELNGRKQTVQQWSREMGIPYTTLRLRVFSGWPPEQALNPRRLNRNRLPFN